MWTRAALKENAKRFFKFNYWKMVLAALIMSLIGGGFGVSFNYQQRYTYEDNMSAAQMAEFKQFLAAFMVLIVFVMIVALLLSVFAFAPLIVGGYRFFVVSHYQKAELREFGLCFRNLHSYLNVVKIMFLRRLYIALWSLLLIVPGIVKTYEYRMIPYILAENPDMDAKEVFAISKKMMDGNKWAAFVLDLSFLGWALLGAVTCGIVAIFWVNPYIQMTNAELYVALKERWQMAWQRPAPQM